MRGFILHEHPPLAEYKIPSDTFFLFLTSCIGGGLATVIAVAGLTGTGTSAAITDFFSNFIYGQKYDPRSLMYITGLVSALVYFFAYYFYISSYIDKIWNHFFAQPNDKNLLYFVSGIQNISTFILVFLPQYWWAFVLVFHITVSAVFAFRYRGFRRAMLERGLAISGSPPIVTHNGQNVHDDPKYKRLVTQLYLFRSGLRSLAWKYPLYSGTFLVMLIGCHVVQHSAGKVANLETLIVGMYIAASILFVVIALIDYTIKGFSVVGTLRDRAEMDDHWYFESLLR